MSPAEELVINVSLQQLGGLGHFAHQCFVYTTTIGQDVRLFYTRLQPEYRDLVGRGSIVIFGRSQPSNLLVNLSKSVCQKALCK